MNEELIIKYLTHSCSADENQALLAWVRRSDANRQEFVDFCTVWQSAKVARFDAQKAHAKFVQATSTSTDSTGSLTASSATGKLISFWKPLMVVAAVALLFVGLFFLHTPQQKQEFVTVANTAVEPLQLLLPDNSEITLQQGAQVTYPAQFAAGARKIEASGVLYCKIAHNEQAPFTVDCKDFTVEVLGTEFEIETTAGNAHVIVESGKVRVCNVATKTTVDLIENERVDVKQYSLRKVQNNDVNVLSWKTGLLKFSNTPLSQVFSDLQRHYKCNITVADKAINTCKITGTYQNMELNEILEIIHSAFPHIHFTLSHTNAGEITVHL
ncbi:MAG: FecR domain-containing protein [Bacteroidetes bacterium]|nr:FecR domain-containing protein [Bacteroidota bacterium]